MPEYIYFLSLLTNMVFSIDLGINSKSYISGKNALQTAFDKIALADHFIKN